jgi:hypothetical protein
MVVRFHPGPLGAVAERNRRNVVRTMLRWQVRILPAPINKKENDITTRNTMAEDKHNMFDEMVETYNTGGKLNKAGLETLHKMMELTLDYLNWSLEEDNMPVLSTEQVRLIGIALATEVDRLAAMLDHGEYE